MKKFKSLGLLLLMLVMLTVPAKAQFSGRSGIYVPSGNGSPTNPGAPGLSCQGADVSATGFVAIPHCTYDPTTGSIVTDAPYFVVANGNLGVGTVPALGEDIEADRSAYITAPVFTPGGGTTKNDVAFSGTPTLPIRQFCVAIDGLGGDGGPDSFSWGVAGSCTSGATGVAITGSAQLLTSGVSVTFSGGPPYQGHSVGDQWTVTSSPGGIIEAATGYQIAHSAVDGHCLRGVDGVYVDGACGVPPGAPALSLQGASADGLSLVGIPNSSFDASTGDVTLGAGLTVNSPSTPINLTYGGGATSHFTFTGSLDTLGHGAGQLYFEQDGTGGIIIDAIGNNYGNSGGTGPVFIGSAGTITLDDNSSGGINILESGTGPIDLTSAGGILATDDSNAGAFIYEKGNGVTGFESDGPGGVLLNSTGNDFLGTGTGPIDLTSAGGISMTDDSADGIAIVESGAGLFTYNGNPILTALVGTTAAIGGSPLTIGQFASGTVVITGATAAIAAGGTAAVFPVTAAAPGAGFIPIVTQTGTLDTLEVDVYCLVAGTPVSTTYEAKVF